jgi:hypothetical protein
MGPAEDRARGPTWMSADMYSSSMHRRVSMNSGLKRPNQAFPRPSNSF